MRILITGSGGRLGALLYAARAHIALGDADLVFQSRAGGRDVIWQLGDDVGRLPACDVVLGLWGVTSGTDETLAQNAELAGHTRSLAKTLGAWGAVHLSSAGIYGPGKALAETADPAPMGGYGAAKLALERAVLTAPDPALAETVLRLANVVGADSLAPALKGLRPAILDRFPNGQGPIRSYIGACDFLRVILALVRLDAAAWPSLLNIAAPHPIAMEDLLGAAGRPVTWRDAPAQAVQEVSLDVTRMTQLLQDAVPDSDARGLIEEWQALETRA